MGHLPPVTNHMPPLTDMAIRKAKPTSRTQKLFDGGGLYMEISPKDGRWWRLKYRFDGKEKRLALGVYPDVPLALARRGIGPRPIHAQLPVPGGVLRRAEFQN